MRTSILKYDVGHFYLLVQRAKKYYIKLRNINTRLFHVKFGQNLCSRSIIKIFPILANMTYLCFEVDYFPKT